MYKILTIPGFIQTEKLEQVRRHSAHYAKAARQKIKEAYIKQNLMESLKEISDSQNKK